MIFYKLINNNGENRHRINCSNNDSNDHIDNNQPTDQ